MARRIAIIGLGLIGGSMGLALKAARGDAVEVVGFARRPQTAARALEMGAVDRTADDMCAAVAAADMAIVATPVLAIADILAHVSSALAEGAVVTDVASTKAQVMRWAADALPPSVSFIGGHPMAGKEQSGIEAADGALFRGCTYCLVPGTGAAPGALETVKGLAQDIGANPLVIDADRHDLLVAGVSHLPLVLAAALVAATTQSPEWPQMAALAATGYRDTTRLASGDPRMGRDICLTNGEHIVHWLDAYAGWLQEVRRLVSQGSDGLEQFLVRAQEERERWLKETHTMKGRVPPWSSE